MYQDIWADVSDITLYDCSQDDQTDRPSTNSYPPGNASSQNEVFDAGDNETEQENVADILVSEAKVPDLLNLDNTDEHLNAKIVRI